MTTAFQRNAFQFGAFQIDPLTHEVRWPGTTVKRKKDKDSGPDIGLVRELQRQRDEAAQRVAAEQAAQRATDEAAAEQARRIAEEAAERGLEELKKSSGVEVRSLLGGPLPVILPAVIGQPRAVEQKISAAAEEEELVLLMLLAQ